MCVKLNSVILNDCNVHGSELSGAVWFDGRATYSFNFMLFLRRFFSLSLVCRPLPYGLFYLISSNRTLKKKNTNSGKSHESQFNCTIRIRTLVTQRKRYASTTNYRSIHRFDETTIQNRTKNANYRIDLSSFTKRGELNYDRNGIYIL